MSVGAAPAASSGASSAASAGSSAGAGAVASAGASSGVAAASSFSGPGSLPSAVNLDFGGSSNSFSSSFRTGAYGMDASSLQSQIDAMNRQQAGKDNDLMTAVAAMMLHRQAFG